MCLGVDLLDLNVHFYLFLGQTFLFLCVSHVCFLVKLDILNNTI